MKETRIAINGFGRIGRSTFKNIAQRDDCRVVGINDLADIGDLAYLLKYDSVHGWYPKKVSNDDSSITVDGERIAFSSEKNPADLPWGDLGVDVVIEATGVFRARDKAVLHLEAGAKKVIVSAPSDDIDVTLVLGVNQDHYDPEAHDVVSMASCTTNCVAPVAKVIHRELGLEHMIFTTVHAYTSSQALKDTPMRKRRRGRAAALSIIPTTTGAAVATERVLPELAGRLDGMAMRVPVPDGSITDMVIQVNEDVTAERVNQILEAAAEEPELSGILRVTHEALVSRDILGDPHSSIVDAESTIVLRDRVVKVLSWYDNEWGYSARLADCAAWIGGQLSG
jgi:glyceraldehyde 3-phosphate dehydrogenase